MHLHPIDVDVSTPPNTIPPVLANEYANAKYYEIDPHKKIEPEFIAIQSKEMSERVAKYRIISCSLTFGHNINTNELT
jgi:hypothetical protein